MEEKVLYVALGACAAVLATFILLILGDLWFQTVLPLWRRWRYRGVNISGGWKGLGTDQVPAPGEWTEVGLSFAQEMQDVRGLLWIRRCCADRCEELHLPVAGRIVGGYLALGPSEAGEEVPPLASALLKIDGRGASLNGQLLYRDEATGTVEGIQMSVHRAASMALPRLRPIALQAGGLATAAGD